MSDDEGAVEILSHRMEQKETPTYILHRPHEGVHKEKVAPAVPIEPRPLWRRIAFVRVLRRKQRTISLRDQERMKEDHGSIHTYTTVCQEIGVLNVVAVVAAELALCAIKCCLPLAELVTWWRVGANGNT